MTDRRRFYCCPESGDCRWMPEHTQKVLHPEWVDMTDASDDDLVAFLTPALGIDEGGES